MVRPTSFKIAEQLHGRTLVLSIAGELDVSTAPQLVERIGEKTEQRPTALILDLSDLSFMDSSGLRLLIDLNRRSARENWQLTLIAPKHEAANTVLRLTGADVALPFEEPPS